MNGPIAVSAPGSSLIGANDAELTLSTKYPFFMLDSTNMVSFQIITLFFAHEPPNPDGVISKYQRTLIYSFPHGYKYTPSTWFLVSVNNFKTALGSEGVYLTGGGGLASASSSVLICTVDATNVNFYIDKYYDSFFAIPAPMIIGFFVAIRAYVAVQDLMGTSVPSHA